MSRDAEKVARTSYGRLLSLVAARTRDLAGAEDALAEAFLAALERWPRDGVPANPEGWLLTAARRRVIDGERRSRTRADAEPALHVLGEEVTVGTGFPDERVKLLFACAHPAIDPELRTPLMLQTVLGLDAEAIGSAFLVAPKTMGQRLWRAKGKIRDAGIAFAIPEPAELPARLGSVLEAVYAAYGAGWDEVPGDPGRGLTDEALWLAQIVAELLPQEPEAGGLYALLCFTESRRAARRAGGAFVPLDEQDPALWSRELIAAAERALSQAAERRRPGPFQLEAAIQSAHVHGRLTGRVDREAIALLWEGLAALTPTIGVRVARAAALGAARGPEPGLSALRAIEGTESYQPRWAAEAHLLAEAGRHDEADAAFTRAAGLCEDPAVRSYLLGKRARRG